MRRLTSVAVGLSLCGTLLILPAGCGTITPSDTIAQAAAKVPLLNQLTVGQAVQGFQAKASSIKQTVARLNAYTKKNCGTSS